MPHFSLSLYFSLTSRWNIFSSIYYLFWFHILYQFFIFYFFFWVVGTIYMLLIFIFSLCIVVSVSSVNNHTIWMARNVKGVVWPTVFQGLWDGWDRSAPHIFILSPSWWEESYARKSVLMTVAWNLFSLILAIKCNDYINKYNWHTLG